MFHVALCSLRVVPLFPGPIPLCSGRDGRGTTSISPPSLSLFSILLLLLSLSSYSSCRGRCFVSFSQATRVRAFSRNQFPAVSVQFLVRAIYAHVRYTRQVCAMIFRRARANSPISLTHGNLHPRSLLFPCVSCSFCRVFGSREKKVGSKDDRCGAALAQKWYWSMVGREIKQKKRLGAGRKDRSPRPK